MSRKASSLSGAEAVVPGQCDVLRTRRPLAAPCLNDVLLTADKLSVNALRHTKSGQDGGSFTVEVVRDGAMIAVSVAAQVGPDEPAAIDVGELAESWRGLRTISLTAASWD